MLTRTQYQLMLENELQYGNVSEERATYLEEEIERVKTAIQEEE